MHVALLMGSAKLLHSARSCWSGTLVCLFQPAEELAEGAIAMIEDASTSTKNTVSLFQISYWVSTRMLLGPAGSHLAPVRS